jgi:hypothetical protein
MTVDPYPPRIPDAQYRAVYLHYEEGRPYGQPRWFAHFQITEPGEQQGVNLTRFYNVPKGRFLPRSHNLFLDFVAVFERRPPTQGVTPDLFKGCEFLVETATVKHQIQGRRRIELPEDCWYSKIDRLIRLTAGSPPFPSGRRGKT